jgi:hypothetical protein
VGNFLPSLIIVVLINYILTFFGRFWQIPTKYVIIIDGKINKYFLLI